MLLYKHNIAIQCHLIKFGMQTVKRTYFTGKSPVDLHVRDVRDRAAWTFSGSSRLSQMSVRQISNFFVSHVCDTDTVIKLTHSTEPPLLHSQTGSLF